jgi:type I restriction enzyme S subunit
MIDGLRPYPSYRESGLPWLGAMPEHWGLVPNRALIRRRKVLVGGRHFEYQLLSLTRGGVIVRDIGSGKGKFSADPGTSQEVRSGDLVFCLFDIPETPRTVGLSRHDGMITGAYTVFECADPLLAAFIDLFYRAADDRKLLSPLYSGLRNTIPPSRFLGTKTPVPPAVEQRAMVRFLDHADRRIRRYIAAKKKLIALLNEQKQAIINRAVTRGLDPSVRLKPSGVEWLGDVPEHWEVRKIGAISARVTKGTTPTTLGRSFTDAGIRFVKVESISKDRRLLPLLCAYIDPETDSLLARSRLRAGDVLVAIAGAIGRVAVAAEEDLPANCNQAVAIVSPVRSSVLPDWLAFALASPACQRVLTDSSVQSAQANLSLADLRGTMIPVPPVSEQGRIVGSLVDSTAVIAGAAAFAEREVSLLREYRTRLVADVVTGKLDVREAAARLPEEVEEPEPLGDAEALAEGDESEDAADPDTAAVEVEV